jgi:hypothetical protein
VICGPLVSIRSSEREYEYLHGEVLTIYIAMGDLGILQRGRIIAALMAFKPLSVVLLLLFQHHHRAAQSAPSSQSSRTKE